MEPLAHGELRGAIQDLAKGTELEDKSKGGVVSKSMVQGFLARHSKEVWSEHPQNMSHLRALWSTWANIDHGFDMFRDLALETGIALKNPHWDTACQELKDDMKVLEILVIRPDSIGVYGEMPFGLVMSSGQKGNADKKIGGYELTIEDLGRDGVEVICGKEFFKDDPLKPNLTTGLKSTLRGPKRVRQQTHRNCKLGTFVGGFKANGEPYPSFLIVKAKMMHKEFTCS